MPELAGTDREVESCGHVHMVGTLAVTCRAVIAPARLCQLGHVTPARAAAAPDSGRRELFDSEDVANTVRAIADDLLTWAETLPTGAAPQEVYDWLIAQAAKVEKPATLLAEQPGGGR